MHRLLNNGVTCTTTATPKYDTFDNFYSEEAPFAMGELDRVAPLLVYLPIKWKRLAGPLTLHHCSWSIYWLSPPVWGHVFLWTCGFSRHITVSNRVPVYLFILCIDGFRFVLVELKLLRRGHRGVGLRFSLSPRFRLFLRLEVFEIKRFEVWSWKFKWL